MDKNEWKVGAAKQRFSEVLRRSEEEPQLIYRRDELVAAVIHVEDETEVPGIGGRSIGDRFAEAREIVRRESYRLPVSKRRSRKDGFSSVIDDLAG
jgi:hypothetical protein